MDLITIYETNFTIFIGIFVTLAVMGTTTLYDRYESKGGASFDLMKIKLFSNQNQQTAAFGSKSLKQFSDYSKKFSSLILNKSISGQEKSSSMKKKSTSIRSNSNNNSFERVEKILFKAKNAVQNLFVNLRSKTLSLSSALPRRSSKDKEKFVSLSDTQKADLNFSAADKANTLDKVVESKKDELDFDDDLLTKMSTSDTLTVSSPELKTVEPSLGSMSLDLDASFDTDFKLDENEFAIKVDGLDDEPDENNFKFSGNTEEIKFGDESDNFLASLKKDIIIKKEKTINFMDNMQGENLDLKLMKSDLECVLKDLKKYRQYSHRN
ncbi:hypothetical protein [Methanosarcina mazei]|jgi:hypothetical protein|uniref:Uncharacterized protein n=4 Tax=Methanosarcina mazei TaxID=2209 RepID=A0A0F8NS24_METMZ|nr:hypothetical protein [Methanosarcina mazei]AGF95773.1 hypothetical protein MmTuc01_0324 [Methanosarcina mazei Tuc01]AKB39964.1 hypothetical protein MSMAW_0973 [Methanosarcina mazei WWM610]KKG05361.1 hypothetical protein DU31_14560 [Methanosarcina mazei]KKG05572.1 hypothetical protein DU40_08785 [Methanosarcina mazei]KKG13728.1 hypothetical protein DU34_11405 [Methanosarcina mazei]